MRLSLLCTAAAAALAAPADADVTATYKPAVAGLDMRMRVEIASNGDLRADMNFPSLFLIRRGGRTYFIQSLPSGPLVADFDDLVAVMQEEMKRMDPQVCETIRSAPPPAKLVDQGPVTIAGRSGEAYGSEGRPPGSRPVLVLSRDPALAPLGAAIAAQFRASAALLGDCGPGVPMFGQMQDLLDAGTPLQFAGMELEKVETGPVDPARFALPAPPATRDQVRERMRLNKDKPVTIQPRSSN